MDLDLIYEIAVTLIAIVGWVFAERGRGWKRLVRELRDLFELAEDSQAPEDIKATAKSVIKEKLS